MTQILSEKFLDYSDILIKPKMGNNLNSRSEVSLIREIKFKFGEIRKGIPVFNANMATVGNFNVAKELLKNNMFATLHKFYTAEDIISFYEECLLENISTDNLFLSIGIKNADADIKKIHTVYSKLSHNQKKFKINICIDAPNFYIPNAFEVLKNCRITFPNSVIMCGNIASSDICQKLLEYADIIKIGIGSGSACLTRKQTGCGVPMVSLILDCADVVHAVDGHICADGGIVEIGDISKAFCLNSDFVMIGGMFAGTNEAEGEIIKKQYITNEAEISKIVIPVINNDNTTQEISLVLPTHVVTTKEFKLYYGMSSTLANNKFAGGMKDYKTSEGRELEVPYTGKLSSILQDIRGGVASACTYIGAKSIKQMSKCATLIQVNNQLNKVFEKYERK